jgi:hypothetical protein
VDGEVPVAGGQVNAVEERGGLQAIERCAHMIGRAEPIQRVAEQLDGAPAG